MTTSAGGARAGLPRFLGGREGSVQPSVSPQLGGLVGGGRTLDAAVRARVEPHVGLDLSAARVHDGAEAEALSPRGGLGGDLPRRVPGALRGVLEVRAPILSLKLSDEDALSDDLLATFGADLRPSRPGGQVFELGAAGATLQVKVAATDPAAASVQAPRDVNPR